MKRGKRLLHMRTMKKISMNFETLIWLEALTPKQALLYSYVYDYLKKRDFNVIVTTREHEFTSKILKNRDTRSVIVGKYGGKELSSKLYASLNRQEGLFLLFKNLNINPLVHSSFTSPDSCRVAFGLGVPIVVLTDSPHSDKVNRLTLPLAETIIVPLCIENKIRKYAISPSRLITFDGVFEVIWCANFKPSLKPLKMLNVEPYNYCIIRPPEVKASYYNYDIKQDIFLKLATKTSEHLTVIYYPRYRDQVFIAKKIAEKIPNIKILETSLDMQSLEKYASFVLTGGSTIAQEAAILGTPSITCFPQKTEITDYLEKKGFPIIHVSSTEMLEKVVLDLIKNSEIYREKTKKLIDKLENPLPLIVDEISKLASKRSHLQ